MKVKKFFVHKKYFDEIWGKLVFKNFSRTKLLVFENYKKKLLSTKFSLHSTYNYFRDGQLTQLKIFKFFSFNLVFIANQIRYLKDFEKFHFISDTGLRVVLSRLYNWKNKIKSNTLNFIFRGVKSPNLRYYFDWVDNFFFKPYFLKLNFTNQIKTKRNVEFFYSTHIIEPPKRFKPLTLFYYKYSYYKKISVFFGFKRVSDFMKYFKKFQTFRLTETDLFIIFQLKLDNFLNTLNFFPSIYFIQKFITGGNVFVNNSIIRFPNYLLQVNQLIFFNKHYFSLIFFYLLKNLKLNRVFLNHPSFVEIDYKTLICLIFKLPDSYTITHPFSFDLHTDFFTPFR